MTDTPTHEDVHALGEQLGIEKRGFVMAFPLEMIATLSSDPRFRRKVADRRRVPPTEAQRAEHRRAKRLLKEIEKNSYIGYDYDGDPYLRELAPTVEIDYAETHDEWLERCKALLTQEGHTS